MIKVALLTDEQAAQLTGREYAQDMIFNPIEDNEERFIISLQEVNQCINQDFLWVKDLPIIDYKPKELPFLFI